MPEHGKGLRGAVVPILKWAATRQGLKENVLLLTRRYLRIKLRVEFRQLKKVVTDSLFRNVAFGLVEVRFSTRSSKTRARFVGYA